MDEIGKRTAALVEVKGGERVAGPGTVACGGSWNLLLR